MEPKRRHPPLRKPRWKAASRFFMAIGGVILLWSSVAAWSFRDGFYPEGPKSRGREAFSRYASKAWPGVVFGAIFLAAGANLAKKEEETRPKSP